MPVIGDRVQYIDYFAGPFLTVLGTGVIRGIIGTTAWVEFEPDPIFNPEISEEWVPFELLKIT